MENKLKELLNDLIKRGRIPFSDKRITNVSWKMQYVGTYNWVFWSNHNVVQFWKSTRELVSKESDLWQFCTENEMVEDKGEIRYKADENNDINDANYMGEFYYWLLESALKDESELEQFLLDNIKIGE